MSDIRFESVYEDHATERIKTMIQGQRGRTIEVHVQHHSPLDSIGERIYTNYTLDLFVVETKNHRGDLVLEVRIINPIDNEMGETRPVTPLVQIAPDPREFR